MNKPIIKIILSQLLTNGEYFIKVYPYLKPEYFDGPPKEVYKSISHLVDTYNTVPSKNSILVHLESQTLSETLYKNSVELVNSLEDTPEDFGWLVDATETYVKDKALFNATSKAILIQENAALPPNKRNKKIPDVGVIPEMMVDALSISFDSDLGHDWVNDYEKRWLLYQSKANKIPFSLEILNKITKGGAELGTLNILLLPTNVGKSLGLCSLAADYVSAGRNVLYISMEMSEIACSKRIDANLLDVSLDELDGDNSRLSYQEFKGRMERLQKTTKLGGLRIKQYPTSAANVNDFRAYMNDLKIKENFIPEIVMVDYLGICSSSRIRTYSENSYTLVKAIAEELRGLAVEKNVILWSAAQTTRSAWDSSDISMGDVAESAGLAHTADFMLGGVETEEHKQQGVQMFKQLKSRYGNKDYYNKFNLGVKKENQRWYETDNNITENNVTLSSNNDVRNKIDEFKF